MVLKVLLETGYDVLLISVILILIGSIGILYSIGFFSEKFLEQQRGESILKVSTVLIFMGFGVLFAWATTEVYIYDNTLGLSTGILSIITWFTLVGRCRGFKNK